MSGGQRLELHAADLGDDVLARYLLVPLEGGIPHRVPHGVDEPAIQVVLHGDGSSLKDEPRSASVMTCRSALSASPFVLADT